MVYSRGRTFRKWYRELWKTSFNNKVLILWVGELNVTYGLDCELIRMNDVT